MTGIINEIKENGLKEYGVLDKEAFNKMCEDIFTPTLSTPKKPFITITPPELKTLYEFLGHEGFRRLLEHNQILTGREGIDFIKELYPEEFSRNKNFSTPLHE